MFVRANFVDIYLQGMRDRSKRSGTELAPEIKLTDWSMAGNLSNRSSGVQTPRDICTRLKRYMYSAKCGWIIKLNATQNKNADWMSSTIIYAALWRNNAWLNSLMLYSFFSVKLRYIKQNTFHLSHESTTHKKVLNNLERRLVCSNALKISLGLSVNPNFRVAYRSVDNSIERNTYYSQKVWKSLRNLFENFQPPVKLLFYQTQRLSPCNTIYPSVSR